MWIIIFWLISISFFKSNCADIRQQLMDDKNMKELAKRGFAFHLAEKILIEGEGVKNVHLKMDFSSVFNDIKAHLEKAIGLDKKPQLEKQVMSVMTAAERQFFGYLADNFGAKSRNEFFNQNFPLGYVIDDNSLKASSITSSNASFAQTRPRRFVFLAIAGVATLYVGARFIENVRGLIGDLKASSNSVFAGDNHDLLEFEYLINQYAEKMRHCLRYMALGMWDCDVLHIQIPSLEKVLREQFGQEFTIHLLDKDFLFASSRFRIRLFDEETKMLHIEMEIPTISGTFIRTKVIHKGFFSNLGNEMVYHQHKIETNYACCNGIGCFPLDMGSCSVTPSSALVFYCKNNALNESFNLFEHFYKLPIETIKVTGNFQRRNSLANFLFIATDFPAIVIDNKQFNLPGPGVYRFHLTELTIDLQPIEPYFTISNEFQPGKNNNFIHKDKSGQFHLLNTFSFFEGIESFFDKSAKENFTFYSVIFFYLVFTIQFYRFLKRCFYQLKNQDR